MHKPELKPRIRLKKIMITGPDDEVIACGSFEVPHPRYKRSRSATKKLKKSSLKNKLISSSTNKKGYDLLRYAKLTK
ncbi:hypothetical protein BH10BAC5_BH10BAC5_23990 [soil metagenome]